MIQKYFLEISFFIIFLLKLLNINNITLDINHLDVCNQLILELALSEEDRTDVSEALIIKDKAALKKILNRYSSALMVLGLCSSNSGRTITHALFMSK
mgnify:CR=1 FL=1